ncbi:hypothetical protein [Paenibacillus sp. PL2-23]|uniref:hypothetical protein n=1 Tax=Paenibacillus sp. PL2-23 TaxID=2100729 RepID=UPI0030FA3CB7
MSRFEVIGPELDTANLAKHNRNLDRADSDLASLQTQISAEQKARIAAVNEHIQAIAAHAASAITLSAVAGMSASTVQAAIAELRTILTTIIAGPAPSAAEIQAARVGADNVARASLDILIKEIHAKQLAAQEQKVTIKRGANVINTSQASGATVQVKGRTLVNILGKDGNFESDSNSDGIANGWSATGADVTMPTLETTGAEIGTRFQRWTSANSGNGLTRVIKTEVGKNYIAICRTKSNIASPNGTHLRIYKGATVAYTSSVGVGSAWATLYVKFVADGTEDSIRLCGSGAGGMLDFDGVRLYEVSAADYAAIGTTITGDAIDAYLPYLDGVQHLQGVSVRKKGKNLLPPFTQWTLHANAEILAPYELKLTATAADQKSTIEIPLLPSTTYKITFNANGRVWTRLYNSNRTAFSNSKQATSGDTITTDATYYVLQVELSSLSVGTFTFTNPQLELGSVATPFEPRVDQYTNVPIKLASNVDRTIADSYDSATGQVLRRWKTDVKLDGALGWTHSADFTGFKRLALSLAGGIANSASIAKYNGAIYELVISGGTPTKGDQQTYNGSTLYVTVSDADSGWTDALNPNTNAVKALMNGWKANGNNGTVYNSWVSIIEGNAPTTNTEAFVAANKAPGWDAWAALDYVFATPVVEQLEGDLGGLSLDAGGNAVELVEGVVVRERITPTLFSGQYYINRISATGSTLLRRADKILAIYKGSDREPITSDINTGWLFGTSDAYGNERYTTATARIDPDAEYYVDYIVLDKYAYTSNAVDATITYDSTQGSVIAQNVQDIAAIKTHDGVQDWILAQHTARLLALEEA